MRPRGRRAYFGAGAHGVQPADDFAYDVTPDPAAAAPTSFDQLMASFGDPVSGDASFGKTFPIAEPDEYQSPTLSPTNSYPAVGGSQETPARVSYSSEDPAVPAAPVDLAVPAAPVEFPAPVAAAEPTVPGISVPVVVHYDEDPDVVVYAREGIDPDLISALEAVLFANASDLHIAVHSTPMIRVDGNLRPVEGTAKWGPAKIRAALLSLISGEQLEDFEKRLELDFAYSLAANARFRVNYYMDRANMAAAFRLIPHEIKPLEQLGIPSGVGRFAELARGLVLVCGPTGSGKSTTLASLIDLVNRQRADHIVTVEDPIEFLHTHKRSVINQREVGADTHSFANALKHVLRQDPDVILVGELRDLETISVALTAAETGHLVFATLHTQDAAQTIDRVIDVFPPHQQGQVRAQLAATLQGVVVQTLVKKASGKGRAVATEVMVITPAIANLIREGKTYQITSSLQAGKDLGMHTMDQHLADLVNEGVITLQAAMDKSHDPTSIERLIHRTERPMEAAAGIDYGDNY